MKRCQACGVRFAPASNRQLRCNRCRFDQPRPGTSFGDRVCAWCGRRFVARTWNQRFCCAEHTWRAHRPKRAARYANRSHGVLRRVLEPVVALGETRCARCGGLILPGEAWDLDHTDDGTGYLGPSHARCNRATAGKQKARLGRIW